MSHAWFLNYRLSSNAPVYKRESPFLWKFSSRREDLSHFTMVRTKVHGHCASEWVRGGESWHSDTSVMVKISPSSRSTTRMNFFLLLNWHETTSILELPAREAGEGVRQRTGSIWGKTLVISLSSVSLNIACPPACQPACLSVRACMSRCERTRYRGWSSYGCVAINRPCAHQICR
eukprot:COSAG02_NODE_12252_length_1573_cov_1.244233_2_plen_176_part_00